MATWISRLIFFFFLNVVGVFFSSLVVRKYTEIRNPEQRAQYKADFNSEYNEYRKLHAIVDRVSKRFSLLKESLRNVAEGTEQWQVVVGSSSYSCLCWKNVDFFFFLGTVDKGSNCSRV